jgi:crossover junction endodeoxyribonuclease RusA
MLQLPWPPTVNTYWRMVSLPKKGGGNWPPRMLISAEGRQYAQDVKAAWLEQEFPRFGKQRLRVYIAAFPPDARRRDLDNLLKGLLDALKTAGVFEDDSQIDDLGIERSSIWPGGMVRVYLDAIEDQQRDLFEARLSEQS